MEKALFQGRTRRELFFLALTMAFCLWFGGKWFLSVRPPEPLSSVASRVYKQILAGDSGGLYQMVHPGEVEAMQLTSRKFDLMIEWLHASLSGFNADGPRIDQKAVGDGLSCTLPLRNGQGRQCALRIVFMQTPDGPKMSLTSLLAEALTVAHVNRYAGVRASLASLYSLRDSLREDRNRLCSFAPGLPRSSGIEVGELMTWDERLRHVLTQDIPALEKETGPDKVYPEPGSGPITPEMLRPNGH
jgi:hypothetical protein